MPLIAPLSDSRATPSAAIPSWLVSLVVHLLVLVSLGLLRLSGEIDRPLVMLVTAPFTQQEEPLLHIAKMDTLVTDAPQENRSRQFQPVSPPGSHLLTLAGNTAVDLMSARFDQDADEPTGGLVPAGDVLMTVVVPQPTQLSVVLDSRRAAPELGGTATDQIVARFIQYDIGQLTGEQGERARTEFEALGPEAIESLIRGVNASACLSASCPVIVIESKLRSTLREANDPLLYRLAVENVGEGVSPRAPYASRLAALRRTLAVESGMASPTIMASATTMARDRSQMLRRLRRASTRTLSESLKDDDAALRAAAIQTISTRGIQLVDELIPLLADPEPAVQWEAHQALVRLARGIDFGPQTEGDDEDRQNAMLLWHDWWQQSQNRKGTSEQSPQDADRRAAADKLRLALLLQRAGKHDTAQRRFREILDEFPDTPAAGQARQYLGP